MKHYSRKLTLSAVEISTISISLRKDLIDTKKALVNASEKDKKGIEESYLKIKKLQQRFQRLAVKIEKEVLKDIKEMQQK